MKNFTEGKFDVVVIGAGHAGCESALACARLGLNTAMLTLNLDSIAFMACNPSIGGTAKGHLVREIDALGGEMGVNADKTALQIRMLNEGKGEAVQSLRCQCDKNAYHREMKKTLENTRNLHIMQGECEKVLVKSGKVYGVKTTYGGVLEAKAVILATGVYLNAETVTGAHRQKSGPSGFAPATKLTKNLIKLGFCVRRFKTGTPARLDGRTINYEKCTQQHGEDGVPPFSFLHEKQPKNARECFITYTNPNTHEIILNNLDRSPLYNGDITSAGPRYCPSIETKVVRFSDKERHQIFLEPEGADTNEIYVQGLSSSMPHDVQKEMYRSVEGLENCEFMRYAYAIEYDCIDTLDVYPTLEFKKVKGLYTAGQINGTSGYEEAAAQGLIAGINAAFKIMKKPPFILGRDEAYIGVLIDDLVTKGTEEPYRMMTSRAEYAIALRQDTADFRLTPKIENTALFTDERREKFKKRADCNARILEILNSRADYATSQSFAKEYCVTGNMQGVTYADLIRRGAKVTDICGYFGILENEPKDVIKTAETTLKYEGYLSKSRAQIERAKKLEEKKLPEDIDYSKIGGLRLEAREKLERVRPVTLGQAGRISGVNPADVTVLMVYLAMAKNTKTEL
ncbi:MAG: tRNA uridine-5-carboxymethylaminomethyl(34) synthesis enzyme MnmG [Clostridia bacterium]|jgi:tRNA uridine 5-carboxymethylaminomethyl modification enzyme|nr:tRNA uridine-5-carboxymethylaminomethyl(34) synthesis enzyme MnmG [Clostridia bacterium]